MSDKKNQKKSTVDLAEKLKKAQKEADKKDAKEEKNSKADTLQSELEQMTELAKRTMADLQNLKRRQEEEKSVWIKMANADLIKNILPILDNLERALTHKPQSDNNGTEQWCKGIEMSINQLKQAMKDAGLEEIECEGKEFNPDLHEAMAQGPGKENTILEIFEKGYRLSDRIIRHAKVKVGNGEKN